MDLVWNMQSKNTLLYFTLLAKLNDFAKIVQRDFVTRFCSLLRLLRLLRPDLLSNLWRHLWSNTIKKTRKMNESRPTMSKNNIKIRHNSFILLVKCFPTLYIFWWRKVFFRFARLGRALFWPSKVYISTKNTNYKYIIFASTGMWTRFLDAMWILSRCSFQ